MLNLLKSFCRDESGAVTIDWVVLTAAIVALAIGAWNAIDDNTVALSETTQAAIAAQ